MNYNYSRKWLAALAASVMFGLLPAQAVDFHVSTAQQLQNALTLAAANGADNNIYLTNGYYTGNFNFNSTGGHNLTIANEPSVTNNSAIAIDGAGLGRGMNLANTGSGNITVRGLTFLRNCGSASIGALRIAGGSNGAILVDTCRFLSPTNTSGMGIEIASGLNATVTNSTSIGTTTGGSGVGILISGVTGSVSIQSCLLSTNNGNAGIGGGFNIAGASDTVIARTTISGNKASLFGAGTINWNSSSGAVSFSENDVSGNSASYGGGAVGINEFGGGSVTISGNNFSGNNGIGNGNYHGGAVHCSGSTVVLYNNTFIGNHSGGDGGGIDCQCTTLTVSNNIFGDNQSDAQLGSGGGAANFSATTMILSGNAFTGNSSAGSGGGAYCSGAVMLSNNTFTSNSSAGAGGGAYCSGTITVSDSVFKQNTATQNGGGLYVTGPTVTLQDNLLANNSQTGASSQGGGIWVNPTANLYMINNTIFGNTAAGSGGGAAFQVNGTVELLNVYNNIIWGNSASGNGADVWLAGTGQQKVFLYNDVNDMYGVWDIAQNLLNVDPKFFDPVNGDYHLQPTSSCRNAGTNGASFLALTDLDGNSRTNAAGQVDLGCYEFNTTATLPADTNADFVISPAEYNAYAAAWKNGQTWTNAPASAPNPNPIPANYVTRTGYLMTNSAGAYHNDGSARPTNWKPGP